jgi:hypothetical protein
MFSNNALFILDGLKSCEYQTAKHLYDELSPSFNTMTVSYCRILPARSRDELFSALYKIRQHCLDDDIAPIIHIEAHGSKGMGIEVGDNQEKITWGELCAHFGEINAITKNNLGVVMATCFGIYAASSIMVDQPSPFYFLIGSAVNISAGEIDDIMKKFYRELFQSKSLSFAMKQVEDKLERFQVEEFIYDIFGRFISESCVGKGRRTRIEGLVTSSIEGGIHPNSENLRMLRQLAKSCTKQSKDIFEHFAGIFMHGRYSIEHEKLYASVVKRHGINNS